MIKEYRASLDRHPQSMSSPSQKSDKDNMPGAEFERLPVQPQIYDCLAYAHRGHASSVAVMMEIRRLNIVGFARFFRSKAVHYLTTGVHYLANGRDVHQSMSSVQRHE
jgi:hypothetical protein